MTSHTSRFTVLILLCCVLGLHNQTAYGKNNTCVSIKPVSDSLKAGCQDSAAIVKIITDAIDLGAPIYNAGLHMGCYRIYEWAAYKILYIYGKTCKETESILRLAVEKSHGDYSDTEKAWFMRAAFDKILGVPTRTGAPENTVPEKKYERKGE